MIAWRRTALHAGMVVLAMAAFAASASGYYHFLHFASRTGPFVPIPEKFDLSALNRNSVYFYVTSDGPSQMYEADSFAAVLSELRLAGSVWDGVRSSALRIADGGLFTKDTPQNTPHIEVTFDEVPPGLLAMGGPLVRAEATDGPGGKFVPILRSVLILNKDISDRPSYGTPFFLTAVHELGHALGLQHTFTSSVMSTEVTRASTKAAPLGADDIAAISLLYPASDFAQNHGSITGQVKMTGGDGVHLASVVALMPNGQAVSALTNPDGTYRIDGLRAGQYMLYVHALPPAVQSDLGSGDIVLPLDASGDPIPGSGPFRTQFYPATYDSRAAALVTVSTAQATSGIDFTVEPRGEPTIYDVTTYSFPGPQTVKPAYINLNQPARSFLVAYGEGVMDGTQTRSGLDAKLLGGAATAIAPGGVHPYFKDNRFLELDFLFTPFSGLGPRHLLLSAGDETYVLPSALTLVDRRPPSIASVTPGASGNGSPIVTVTGSDFGADTRIYFDGIQAPIVNTDLGNGNIVVTPPPAPLNYQSRVVALNGDGQSSLFVQQPPLFKYDSGPSDSPSIALSPAALAAGSEAMIEITATNMTFVPGQVRVGLGSSDAVVNQVWVVGPSTVRANVYVMPNAHQGDTLVSVRSGFQTASLPGAFHIGPVASGPGLGSDIRDAATGLAGVYPGGTGIVPVFNLPSTATASNLKLLLNDRSVPVVSLGDNTLTFQVPADMPTGPAVVKLEVGDITTAPVFVVIGPAPPVITSVVDAGTNLDAKHAANHGDQLKVTASNLGDSGTEVAAARLTITIGGVGVPILSAAHPVDGNPQLHQVTTVLAASVPAGQVQLVVSIDGRASLPFTILVSGGSGETQPPGDGGGSGSGEAGGDG